MKIVADTNIPFVKEAFSSLGQVETCEGRGMSKEHLIDADILLVRSVTKVNESLLAKSKIKFVGSATIGVDHVDQDYLKEHSITFANAPGSNATSAAEYVVTALLLTAQKQGFELNKKLVGIVGCGNVGSRVLKRLTDLGVNCIVNDPPRAAKYTDMDYVSLDKVSNADIVTVHTPLIKQGVYKTHHLFDRDRFNALKRDAIFINTSRGSVVDESALKSVIQKRSDLTLILDVWENEPAIDIELLKLVSIGTPHIAGYSIDGKVRGTEMIYASACRQFEHAGHWKVENAELPDSAVIDLTDPLIVSQNLNEDQLLTKVVTSAYNILKDDSDLRDIARKPSLDRAAYFDKLRKNYPIRREFSSQRVSVSPEHIGLSKKLTALGFKLCVDCQV